MFFSSYELFTFDEEHTCISDKHKSAKLCCAEHIKNFVDNHPDLEHSSNGEMYDQVMFDTISLKGYKEVDTPARDVILRYIKNARIRPTVKKEIKR